MDLVFFGIQGSGKGTQARKLAAEFGYVVFEAGGELRRIKESGSELGKLIASYIDVGKLVPHDVIMRVCREAVAAHPASVQVLFDGIPRDLDQMRDFDAIMRDARRTFHCVHFVVDTEQCVQRILKRAKLEGRDDDVDEAIVRHRMQTFQEKTMPVIQQYRAQRKVIDVDGEGTVAEVYARLKAALGLD